jgi:predicted alpha/beta hydrolase family esterase
VTTTLINLPGIGGSGEQHWQTIWELSDPRIVRFKPASWDQPELIDWIKALEAAVRASVEPPVLVAHSLACLLVAHWSATSRSSIAGAFLVCVPDPLGAQFPIEAASFRGVPPTPLRFPSLVVASSNDPYSAIDVVRQRAHQWHAGLLEVGAAGHINAASDLGDWALGRMLLEAFCAGTSRTEA